MTDDVSVANTDRLAMITTKIERESRFTRVVVVVCTIANLAVFVFGLMKAFEFFPPTLLAYFMENMPKIYLQHRAIEQRLNPDHHLVAPKATTGGDQ
jgi:hypothetical protein